MKVTIKYYYPMLIAILEVVTNEVGYFEFKTELDFFEIILAEVEISKQGYETYFASSDPKFLQNKGIALCDTYNYTFKESIKLHLKESWIINLFMRIGSYFYFVRRIMNFDLFSLYHLKIQRKDTTKGKILNQMVILPFNDTIS